jgi:hypothetical protein
MIYPVWMDNSTGIYQIWTVPIEISSVNVKHEYQSPGDYLLNQNYPNPFNPSTIISWESPVGGWQTLKIYDALGNEIATLVNEYRPAGKYETEFFVKTSPSSGGNGYKLKSGIYFYQLRVGNYVETRKMLLLK